MISSHFKDPTVIEALFSTDLPGTVEGSRLPNEFQWAPPGVHSINASRGGKPTALTVNVDEMGARNVTARFAEYGAAASRGEGDSPYGDFNHDDQEASFHPKSFYWGGDDPRSGGIRVTIAWTGAGKRAVLGRDYSRFSPSFYVNDKTGEITGIPVCVGGLVNAAAFRRIAPIMSKRAEADALIAPGDFMTKAKALGRARNLDFVDAASALARQDPYLYECYRWEVQGLGGRAPEPPSRLPMHATAAYRNEFCLQAMALADALDISEAKAIDQLAHKQPALYERYRSALGLGDSRRYGEAVTEAHAQAEKSEFFTLAKRIAAEQTIDITGAFLVAARQRPDLYDAFQASL